MSGVLSYPKTLKNSSIRFFNKNKYDKMSVFCYFICNFAFHFNNYH